jgi:hypothetical protein
MSSIADYITATLAEFYTGTAIPDAPKHTGRLPLSDAETKLSVPKACLYAPEPHLVPERIAERVFYRHEDTPLNTIFFSRANIDVIHGQIRQTVNRMSGEKNYQIDNQSEDDLLTIMRSYYLQHARNDASRVAEEVVELNDRVVSFSANRIMVEIEAYKHYRKDILDFPEPIARPVDVQIYGTRTGELKSFF